MPELIKVKTTSKKFKYQFKRLNLKSLQALSVCGNFCRSWWQVLGSQYISQDLPELGLLDKTSLAVNTSSTTSPSVSEICKLSLLWQLLRLKWFVGGNSVVAVLITFVQSVNYFINYLYLSNFCFVCCCFLNASADCHCHIN